jgi:heptosyltransferase-2
VAWLGDRHAVHRYLALSAAAGGEPASADPQPELAVSDRNSIYVEEMLANEGIGADEPVVCFAPGSVWGTKQWTPHGYAEVARRSASEGMRPVLIGSPEERTLCLEVGEAAGNVPVLAGRTGLPQLAALLKRAEALVGNDSGPAHIASAVGTPVVAVFGPTVPAFGYTPFGSNVRVVERSGLECRPCHHHGPQVCPLDHFRCMSEIEAETVFRQLQDLLET